MNGEVQMLFIEEPLQIEASLVEVEGFKKLGLVYTMDHEVIPRPCKISDGLLNLSRDHFGLYQGKHVGMTKSSRSLKKYFRAYVIH